MDSVFRREVHAYSNVLSIDYDDHEPLPMDDIDIPIDLQLPEDDDMMVEKKEEWTDYGLSQFLSTLPPPASAESAKKSGGTTKTSER